MKVAMLVAVVALAGCQQSTEEVADETNATLAVSGTDEVAACITRGVAYFKEIGSYPTLKSAPNKGRSADEVATERCNRSSMAFGK